MVYITCGDIFIHVFLIESIAPFKETERPLSGVYNDLHRLSHPDCVGLVPARRVSAVAGVGVGWGWGACVLWCIVRFYVSVYRFV